MSRIYQYPVVTEISSDDYLALGSATNGSRAILASDLAPVIGNKTITERGTYKASDDNMDGYGQVTVDIPYTDIHVASGDIATFEGEDLPLKSLKVTVTPVQDLSHGDPSPENICPIIGWDEAVVTRCGKNLWGGEKLADDIVAKVPQATKDTTNKTVSYSASNVRYVTLFNKFKTNTQYIFYFSTESSYVNVAIIFTDGTVYAPLPNTYYTTPSNKSIARLEGVWSSGTTILKYEECGVFEGVITAEDFEPYNGATYTIDLDGTRYGGVVDAVNGTMTVDRVKLTNDYLINTAGYENAGRGCFALSGITLKNSGSDVVDTKLIASALKTSSQNDLYTNRKIGVAHWWNTKIGFSTGNETITTVSAFKQWLADNGSDVVYELATPITVQLAPQPVKSLEGENNIFANCGAVDVEYQTVWVRPTN